MDILNEYEPADSLEEENILIEATTGQRFLNYLIDNILMRFTFTYATGYLAGYTLAIIFPEFMRSVLSDNFSLYLLAYIIVVLNYLIYYTLCEKLFKGYTLGKLITGTRAIKTNGDDLTFKDAFLRSLSRLVPFEAFSGFGQPWHDRWTETCVIKVRK